MNLPTSLLSLDSLSSRLPGGEGRVRRILLFYV